MSGINLQTNQSIPEKISVNKPVSIAVGKTPVIIENVTSTIKKESINLSIIPKSKTPAIIVELAEKSVAPSAVTVAKSTGKKILGSGLMGVPMDGALNIFSYHSGKINSSQYVAKTADGFANWSVFEAGQIGAIALASAVIGKKVGPLGAMVIGTGTGLIASSIYTKTVGKDVENKIAKAIPENISKPFADKLDKYFATPIDKYVLSPIKEHPKTSVAVGAGIVTALTIKYPVAFGKNMLLGTIGAYSINYGANLIIDKALKADDKKDKPSLPPITQPVTKAELDWAIPLEEKFQKDKNSVSDNDALKYENILERYEYQQKNK